jgi:hypothetical protein
MKNNILDLSAWRAYTDALEILRVARVKVIQEEADPLDVNGPPAWHILFRAHLHLARKQKGFELITQLRKGQ